MFSLYELCFLFQIHTREAEYLLGGLLDGVDTLGTRARIDFHLFSNKNRDAIITSGCGGLDKGLEALESLISEPQSRELQDCEFIFSTYVCFFFFC